MQCRGTPTTLVVLLAQFLPVKAHIGVYKSHNQDNSDALGAAHGPEIQCPSVLVSMKPSKPDFLLFGQDVHSVTFAFYLCRSYSNSVYLLHDTFSWQIDPVKLLSSHIDFQASHKTVSSNARGNRNIPDEWNGFSAILNYSFFVALIRNACDRRSQWCFRVKTIKLNENPNR